MKQGALGDSQEAFLSFPDSNSKMFSNICCLKDSVRRCPFFGVLFKCIPLLEGSGDTALFWDSVQYEKDCFSLSLSLSLSFSLSLSVSTHTHTHTHTPYTAGEQGSVLGRVDSSFRLVNGDKGLLKSGNMLEKENLTGESDFFSFWLAETRRGLGERSCDEWLVSNGTLMLPGP